MIYAQQLDERTYCLVNENGSSVGTDGTLAYHPCFFIGQAKDSIYPVYIPKPLEDSETGKRRGAHYVGDKKGE